MLVYFHYFIIYFLILTDMFSEKYAKLYYNSLTRCFFSPNVRNYQVEASKHLLVMVRKKKSASNS